MDHIAGHVTALLDAAGIPCMQVGPNEICTTDIDGARHVLDSKTSWQQDYLGVTCDGTHVALLPVTELPASPR